MKLVNIQLSASIVLVICFIISWAAMPLSFYHDSYQTYYALTYSYVPFINILGIIALLICLVLLWLTPKKEGKEIKKHKKWKFSAIVTIVISATVIFNILLKIYYAVTE